MGAGWNQHEHDAYGIGLPPMKERFDRLEEAIAVIRALWQGGPVDAPGRYYPLRGATLNPLAGVDPYPGAIGPEEMRHAVNAIRDTLREMGITQIAPAAATKAAADVIAVTQNSVVL